MYISGMHVFHQIKLIQTPPRTPHAILGLGVWWRSHVERYFHSHGQIGQVNGNHDNWVCGGPDCGDSSDNFGIGQMQPPDSADHRQGGSRKKSQEVAFVYICLYFFPQKL